MASVLYLALFELSGLMVEFGLSRRKSLTIKIWLGLVIGLMELMWLPSLYAFAFGFGLTAHYFAAATALALGVTLPVVRMIKHKPAYGKKEARPPIWLMLLLLVPLAALAANLHYTHSLREIDGALYTGQSTFGDLCMHAGFITGLIGQSYPPEYTILPGTRLGYPFLVDALSSSLYLFGMPLSLSIMIPGFLMTALIFLGFLLFSWEITRSRAASALALICLVFGGGLGFLYYLDLNGTFDLNTLGYVSAQRFSAINDAFGQYYFAPANYPKLNLRWVNALCDLIIPQRTLMAGWLCVIPALYLLYTAMKNNRRRDFVLLGLFAGPMVMIHTHSFLGLGVISLGAFIDRLIRGDKAKKDAYKQNDGFEAFLVNRQPIAVNFMLYGLTAVLLALPQLLVWTFPQTFGSGTLRLLFNWVNNNEDGTLKDSWLWFWIKNVGPMFVIIPIAALVSRNRRVKALALGSLLLFVLAENVVFQPNTYDNNKLFWVAYLCMLPVGAGCAVKCISAQKHLLTRICSWIVLLALLTTSGLISVGREVISGMMPLENASEDQKAWEYEGDEEESEEEESDGKEPDERPYTVFAFLSTVRAAAEQAKYTPALQLFSAPQVEAARFIRENTFGDAVFLTDTNHNNAVAVLAGRRIVCGSELYLFFHGVDYSERQNDAKTMLAYPALCGELFKRYEVDYAFIASYELSAGARNSEFAALYPLIFESDSEYWYDQVRIYAVSERAQERYRASLAEQES